MKVIQDRGLQGRILERGSSSFEPESTLDTVTETERPSEVFENLAVPPEGRLVVRPSVNNEISKALGDLADITRELLGGPKDDDRKLLEEAGKSIDKALLSANHSSERGLEAAKGFINIAANFLLLHQIALESAGHEFLLQAERPLADALNTLSLYLAYPENPALLLDAWNSIDTARANLPKLS